MPLICITRYRRKGMTATCTRQTIPKARSRDIALKSAVPRVLHGPRQARLGRTPDPRRIAMFRKIHIAAVMMLAGSLMSGSANAGLQFNGSRANGLQFNDVQFNGVQFNGVQFNGVQFNALIDNALIDNALIDNALIDNALTPTAIKRASGAVSTNFTARVIAVEFAAPVVTK
jgi:hypothetical protein